MSEPDFTAPESIADFDDAFENWISGASLTRRSVIIYGKPSLAAEAESLERERQALMDAEVESSAGGNPRLLEVEERLIEIHAEWEASKSEWIVEDISPVVNEVEEATGPRPVAPEPLSEPLLPRGATETQKRAHTVAVQRYEAAKPAHDALVADYEAAVNKWHESYTLHLIARAVVEVRFSDGRTADGVTVERLQKLRHAVGELQVSRLSDAVRQAMLSEPVMTAPFSRRDSEDIPE